MTSDDREVASTTQARARPPESAPGIPKDHDPDDPRDLRNILTAAQVDKLRTGYDRAMMNEAATMALAAPYPPGRHLAEFIIKHFYMSKRWPPDRREQCVITYFASQSAGNDANLGIHVYWGLMEGLSPDVIADTILLATAYSGIENYSNGLAVLTRVLKALKALVEAPDADSAVQCMNVVMRLRG